MWQITLIALTTISIILWRRAGFQDKYRLDVLTSISSGATIMFIVDSVFNYLEEGVFLELSLSALTLGILLIILIIAMWIAIILLAKIFESK